MIMKRALMWQIILMLGIIAIPVQSNAQYLFVKYGFIDREFFFKPASVSPHNFGIFGEIAPWFFDHPVQDAFLNPAKLGENIPSNNYFYTDFRSLPNIERDMYRFPSEQSPYGYPSFHGSIFPHTTTKVKTKSEEPLFNAAWIYRPSQIEDLVIGVMYRQTITSDRYYDKYYRGGFYLMRSSLPTDIPHVELGRQQYDRFRQQGYFPTFMASLRLSELVTAGIKTGMSYYSGHGTLHDGRFNADEISIGWFIPASMNKSADAAPGTTNRVVNTFIDRGIDQRYIQWEGAAGVQVDIPEIGLAGLTAGLLYGDIDQLLGIDHFFIRSEGERYIDENWYRQGEIFSISQNWQRSGYHYYGSVDFQRLLGNNNSDRIQIFYRIGRTSLNVDRHGSGYTFYNNEYTYAAAPDTQEIFWTESMSMQGDNGSGTVEGWDHRMGITSQLKLGRRSVLLLGLQFGRRSQTRNMTSNSEIRWRTDSEHPSLNQEQPTYYKTRQVGTEAVENRDRVKSLYVPASLGITVTDRFLVDISFLLQVNTYTLKGDRVSTTHLFERETSEESYTLDPSTYTWSWSEKEDESIAAVMIGIDYRIVPDVRIRLAGVTATRSSEMRDEIAGLRSTRLHDGVAINKTRFMLGLEAGF